jgi:hypothetical protein
MRRSANSPVHESHPGAIRFARSSKTAANNGCSFLGVIFSLFASCECVCVCMFVIRKQLFLFQSAQNDGLEWRTQDVTPEMAITMYRAARLNRSSNSQKRSRRTHPCLLLLLKREVDDPSYFFARAFQMSLPLLFIALGPWRLRDGPARRIYMPATGCAPPIKHNEDDGCPSRHVRAPRTLFRTKSRSRHSQWNQLCPATTSIVVMERDEHATIISFQRAATVLRKTWPSCTI